MCKIKDSLLQAEEIKYQHYFSFMEHLYEMMPKQTKLSEFDINNMERDLIKPLPHEDIIVSELPLNNKYYEVKKENYYVK